MIYRLSNDGNVEYFMATPQLVQVSGLQAFTRDGEQFIVAVKKLVIHMTAEVVIYKWT